VVDAGIQGNCIFASTNLSRQIEGHPSRTHTAIASYSLLISAAVDANKSSQFRSKYCTYVGASCLSIAATIMVLGLVECFVSCTYVLLA